MELFLHYLSLPYLIQGIWFTLAATGIGLAGGVVLGLLLAAMQLSRFKPMAMIARGYAVIFRGTPLVLQLVQPLLELLAPHVLELVLQVEQLAGFDHHFHT